MKANTFKRDSEGYYYQSSQSSGWLDLCHEKFREQYPEFYRITSDKTVQKILGNLQSPNPSERDRLWLNGFLGCKKVSYSFAERFHIIDRFNQWEDYSPQTTKRKMRQQDEYLASGGKFGSERSRDGLSIEFNDCTTADSHHRQLNLTRVAECLIDFADSSNTLSPTDRESLKALGSDIMGLEE